MEKIFNQIAKDNGTTGEQVKTEISKAINQAMENSKGNPEAESFWKNISQNGETPTADEVVKAIVAKILSESNGKRS